MKTEFITLSMAGAFALLFAGFLLGEYYIQRDPFYVLLAALLLMIVRNDALTGFVNGTYKRGWIMFKRTGDIKND